MRTKNISKNLLFTVAVVLIFLFQLIEDWKDFMLGISGK
jgi:hypothetical protein